ncbi:cryptic autophosphorylating protein tyrosine kinase Etk [Roseibium album]|nr:cryptic autophosphorylating protein tyrosine kinase Etk [Roseibium album]
MDNEGVSLLDPVELLLALYRKRWIVAVIAAIVVGLTLVYLLQTQSIYRATTQVLLNQEQRPLFEDPTNAFSLGRDPVFVDSQVALVSSASVLRPVVLSRNLIDDPEFGTGADRPGPFSILMDILFGSFFQSEPGSSSSERQIIDTIEALREALSVSREGSTYVIDITVGSTRPDTAAILSNAVAQSYLNVASNGVDGQSGALANDLDKQVAALRDQVRTAQGKVQKFRADNNLQNAADGTLLVESELDGLNQQFVQAQSTLAQAQASYDELQQFLEQKLSPSSLGDLVVSQSINQLLDQYNTTVRNEAALANELLPSHPSLAQARAQIARLERLIRNELSGLSESKRVERDVAENRVKNIQAQLDRTRTNSSQDEELLITLRDLEADAETSREVYQRVLAKSKEVANLEQFSIPIAQIISPAFTPKNPSWPRKKLILAASGVFGVLLGIGTVLAFEAFKMVSSLLRGHLMARGLKRTEPARPSRAAAMAPAPLQPRPVRRSARLGRRRERDSNLGCIPSLGGPQISTYQVLNFGETYETAFDYLTAENDRQMPREGREFVEAVEGLEEAITGSLRRSAGSTLLLTTQSNAEELHLAAFSIACASAVHGNRVLLIDGDPQNKELSWVVETAGGRLGAYFTDKDDGLDGLELDFVSLVDKLQKYKEFSLSEQQIYKLDRLASAYDLLVIAAGQTDQEERSPFTSIADCSLNVTQDRGSGSLLISHNAQD